MGDLLFLFGFLPMALAIYYICSEKIRPYLLLLFSMVFYVWNSSQYVCLLIAAVFMNVGAAYIVDRYRVSRRPIGRIFLVITVLFNVLLLGYYKYSDLLGGIFRNIIGREYCAANLTLPLGISFFTFKAISYLLDVYRGEVKATGNPIYAVNYLSFFGQMQIGPISRYGNMTYDNLNASRGGGGGLRG